MANDLAFYFCGCKPNSIDPAVTVNRGTEVGSAGVALGGWFGFEKFTASGPQTVIASSTNGPFDGLFFGVLVIAGSTSSSVTTSGASTTLWRDDSMAFEYFENGYEQNFNPPFSWDVLGSPPQSITLDAKPNTPGALDILTILSGGAITPPTDFPLLIPDDFSWVLKFGMLADMLTKETESRDLIRAQYCEQRFAEGVQLMMELPWLVQARIDEIPVDTPSFFEADQYDNEWQTNPSAIAQIVRGGIDLFAISPTIPVDGSIGLTLSLIGNMPIPSADGDFIQITRDAVDAILDEAEHLAQFKEGGVEFTDSIQLHQRFLSVAMKTNSRLAESGIFPTDLRRTISKEDEAVPRFALSGESSK